MQTIFGPLRIAAVVVGLAVAMPARAALDDVIVAKSADVHSEQFADKQLLVRERGAIREFAGDDGKVFAVVWHSRAGANLNELLGPYLADYRAARAAHRPSHTHLELHTATVNVSLTSHGRMHMGTIYLPQRLPTGVTIHALH